jgi:hypothetical protein
MKTRKIDARIESQRVPCEYGNTFEREVVGGVERLRVGLDDAQDGCVRALASGLIGPFQLLYVLHTTRTGADLGRYESPLLSAAQIHEFMQRFGPFLAQDARHDFWVRSHDDDATIVLDRHNLIYVYGQLTSVETVLRRIGATMSGLPLIPRAHVHYYHQQWDAAERDILAALPWTRTPLHESEIQYKPDANSG